MSHKRRDLAEFARFWGTILALAGVGCSADPAPPPSIVPADFETKLVEVRNCRLSPAEHDGYYVRVFADAIAEKPYLANAAEMPVDALVVKGEYDDAACSKLVRIAAMRKLAKGADPTLHDWQWQRSSAQRVVDESAAERSCAGCHASCKARDYLCTDP